MSFGLINSVLLENPICVFSFNSLASLHGNCLSIHCVSKGGKICLTERMQRHLLINQKVLKDKGLNHKIAMMESGAIAFENDWELFENILTRGKDKFSETTLEYFEIAEHYRLRLASHIEMAKGLVRGIFNLLRLSFGKSFTSSETVWGKDFRNQINEYERIFHRLVHECESHSVGGIYRLYELTKGGKYKERHFPRFYGLCLLFAFGHGAPASPYTDLPESISELVARFEFFENFSESHESYLKTVYQQ